MVLTAALRRIGLPCASAHAGDGGRLRGTVRRPRWRCAASLSSLFFRSAAKPTAAAGGASRPPKGLSNSGSWGERIGKGGGARGALRGPDCGSPSNWPALRLGSRRGRRSAPGDRLTGRGGAAPLLLFSFFFAPLPALVCAGVSAPGNGPGRRPPPLGTTRTGPPRRRGRAASRVSQNSPRSSGALGRGVQSPRRRQRRPRGARRFRLDQSHPTLSPNVAPVTKTKSTTLSGGSLGSCVDEERS